MLLLEYVTEAFRSSRQISLLFTVLLLLLPFSASANQVVINEVMASNDATIADIDGDYPDWVELFNAGRETVSLLGYGLSDDLDDPFKWVFPDVSLEPVSFLLVFASGKDYTAWPGELHTNFSIRAGGEEVLLTAPDSTTIDQLDPIAMATDVSYGRVPDGGPDWWFFLEPTPGSSNGDEPPLQRAPSPIFSPPSGYYPLLTELTISCDDPSAVIRHTLDGHTPGDTSAVYAGPLILGGTTVVRAVSFVMGMLPSVTTTGSYILEYDRLLPVVSIATDPENLWDEETGIYVEGPNADPEVPHYGANYWQDWEIPVHFDFLESDGSLAVSLDAGAKIYGGHTRWLPQKSLRITARDQYGPDRIEYQLFPSEAISSFKSIILRNSGNDWWATMFRDALMTTLMEGSAVAYQAYRPLVVFLNGEYWGIHNLRERLDEHYLAAHYGVDKDSVDIIENHFFPNVGDSLTYAALVEFVGNHDLSDPAAYAFVQTMMDVESFARYQAAEIYYANIDWPANNVRCWRPKREGGRFQWLLYDTDLGFGLTGTYDHNTLEFATDPNSPDWQNAPYATLLLRSLLDNDDFREMFIVRFCDLMNMFFEHNLVAAHINAIQRGITEEMPLHEQRWYPYHNWDEAVSALYEFALLRKGYVVEHLRTKFGLDGTIRLTIERAGEPGGRVRVNPFMPNTYPWDGDYFKGLPIILRAEPFNGYQFVGWEGGVVSSEDSVVVFPHTDIVVQARFEVANHAPAAVVITEINYHSADDFDVGDWIEIYACEGDHDLGGWILRDEQENNAYTIPGGTVLDEGDYLVFAADLQAFISLFPDISGVLGDIGFNLANGGDEVRLYDQNGVLIDQVIYDDEPPWPVEPDGNGPTLRLIDPAYPNESAFSWRASLTPHGDPGAGYGSVLPLWLHLDAGELTLTWQPWPDAYRYWVYGARNLAYFLPQTVFPHQYLCAVLPASATSWSSPEGVGDPANNWTYLLVVTDHFGQEIARSLRVGAHDFSLVAPTPYPHDLR